ncbi:MAG: GAF domain-containing protein [Chloroflexota bacterium]
MATFLSLINIVLQSAIVIFGSTIVLYNLPYFRRDRVTRAFSLLTSFVVIVYVAELIVSIGVPVATAATWLRAEWVGIAQVPAALLHLSDVLLISTGSVSNRRRFTVYGTYLISAVFMTLAMLTNLVVADVIQQNGLTYLSSSTLFPFFSLFFIVVTGLAIWNIWRARNRTIIPITRRRLTLVLGGALAAPIGVYPYLLISSSRTAPTLESINILLFFGNFVVGAMFAILTSQLVYFALTSSPARVVRIRLYKYMARVPLAATLVLAAYVLVQDGANFLGLPENLAVPFAVVATVIVVEWAIHTFKRSLERIFQLNDDPDIQRIQLLSERIVTTREMHEFLESILATTCNALQSPSAFVVTYTPEGPKMERSIGLSFEGDQIAMGEELQSIVINRQSGVVAAGDFGDYPIAVGNDDLIRWQNFWIRPLRDRKGKDLLGIFGIRMREETPYLTEDEADLFNRLADQAAAALEDQVLQRQVFAAVEGLLPQVTEFQQRRNMAATSDPTPALTQSAEELELLNDPDFSTLVKDALNHYWGGPRLTESPLLRLSVVQKALDENEDNPTRALRYILTKAIEQQKPEGDRSWTSAEWILYNILELKFLEGRKVRDIARRLAMSESDLYRKQRVAIENVAKTISEMERGS